VEAKVTDLFKAAKESVVGGKVAYKIYSNPYYSLQVITSGSVNRWRLAFVNELCLHAS